MGAHPDTIGMNDHRMSFFLHVFFRQGHGIHGVEHILAIAINDLQVLEALEVRCRIRIGRLVGLGHRYSVFIVLEHEDHRQFLVGGSVNGFVNIAFRGGRFALRTDGHTTSAVTFNSPGHPHGMQGMVAGTGGNIVDVPFRFGKVVRHMAAAAGNIVFLRQAVEDDLLRRQPR